MKLGAVKFFALFLIAACAHINWAAAQNIPQKSPKTACVAVKDIKAPQLYGLWQVSFTNPPPGLPATASMLLEKHAEFSDSLQGVLTRKLLAKPNSNSNSNSNANPKQNAKPDDKLVDRAANQSADKASGKKTTEATDPASDKDGHAPTAALAGDVEDGLVILDESSNNISISGTWNGQLVDGSCGRQVKGLWKDTSASAPPDAPDVPFTMKKLSSW